MERKSSTPRISERETLNVEDNIKPFKTPRFVTKRKRDEEIVDSVNTLTPRRSARRANLDKSQIEELNLTPIPVKTRNRNKKPNEDFNEEEYIHEDSLKVPRSISKIETSKTPKKDNLIELSTKKKSRKNIFVEENQENITENDNEIIKSDSIEILKQVSKEIKKGKHKKQKKSSKKSIKAKPRSDNEDEEDINDEKNYDKSVHLNGNETVTEEMSNDNIDNLNMIEEAKQTISEEKKEDLPHPDIENVQLKSGDDKDSNEKEKNEKQIDAKILIENDPILLENSKDLNDFITEKSPIKESTDETDLQPDNTNLVNDVESKNLDSSNDLFSSDQQIDTNKSVTELNVTTDIVKSTDDLNLNNSIDASSPIKITNSVEMMDSIENVQVKLNETIELPEINKSSPVKITNSVEMMDSIENVSVKLNETIELSEINKSSPIKITNSVEMMDSIENVPVKLNETIELPEINNKSDIESSNKTDQMETENPEHTEMTKITFNEKSTENKLNEENSIIETKLVERQESVPECEEIKSEDDISMKMDTEISNVKNNNISLSSTEDMKLLVSSPESSIKIESKRISFIDLTGKETPYKPFIFNAKNNDDENDNDKIIDLNNSSLIILPDTPDDSPNVTRTLNETFSPEPSEILFKSSKMESFDQLKEVEEEVKKVVEILNVDNKTEKDIEKVEIIYGTPKVTPKIKTEWKPVPNTPHSIKNSFGKSSTTTLNHKTPEKLNSIKKTVHSITRSAKKSNIETVQKMLNGSTPKKIDPNLTATLLSTTKLTTTNKLTEKKQIKSIRKRRSMSLADVSIAKKVTFNSPMNMEITMDDIDEQIKKKDDRKPIRRKLRSLSNAETESDKKEKMGDIDFTPKREKVNHVHPNIRIKIPDFAAIHRKQFEKMDSIVEHNEKKLDRAKVLSGTKKVIEPVHKITKSDNSRIPRFNLFGNNNKSAPDLRTVGKTNSIEEKQKIIVGLKKTTSIHDLRNVKVKDKVAERKEKHMASYKSRTQANKNEPSTRNENAKILKGVRTNRRFDLQMQFRNLHAD